MLLHRNLEMEELFSLRGRAVEYMGAVGCLIYFSIAVMKKHVQGNHRRKFYLAYGSRGRIVHDYGEEVAGDS